MNTVILTDYSCLFEAVKIHYQIIAVQQKSVTTRQIIHCEILVNTRQVVVNGLLNYQVFNCTKKQLSDY